VAMSQCRRPQSRRRLVSESQAQYHRGAERAFPLFNSIVTLEPLGYAMSFEPSVQIYERY
jgi:hypothetical protein